MAIYTDDKFSITFVQKEGGFVFENIAPGTADDEIMRALSEKQEPVYGALERHIGGLFDKVIDATRAAGRNVDIDAIASLVRTALLGLQAGGEKSSAQVELNMMVIEAFERSFGALKNTRSLESAPETKPSGSERSSGAMVSAESVDGDASGDPRYAAFDAQVEELDKTLEAMGDRVKTPDVVEATVANPAAPKTTIDAYGATVITIAERRAIVPLSPRDVMGFDVHVQTAQAALKDMGYKIAEANGRQDLATNAAFEKFAQDHKIDAGSMTLEDFKEYAVATQQGLDPSTMVASSSPNISGEFLHKASATVPVRSDGPAKETGTPPLHTTPPQELSAIDEHIRIMTGGLDPDKQNRYDPNAPSLRESFNQLAKGIMFWRNDPENEAAADQSNQQEAPQGAPVENRTLPATPPPGSQWT